MAEVTTERSFLGPHHHWHRVLRTCTSGQQDILGDVGIV
jgi:hypothetical protein